MNFLGKLFNRKKEVAIGIDIGSSSIKVVQLSKQKGKAVLDTYGALSLGPYANEEVGKSTNLNINKISEALADILREAKVTSKSGGIAIPFSSSLMTVIELPAASAKNLANIVPLEAKKYVPVSINEVSLDWSIVPKDEVRRDENPSASGGEENLGKNDGKKSRQKDKEQGTIEVLIVAIHNDVIKKFKDIAETVSFESNFFEIEVFSAMRAVMDEESGPALIVDFGASSTKLYVVERGNVRSTHTTNRGSQDVTEAIARSLGVSTKEAEILKRTVGLNSAENRELYDAAFTTLDYIFSESNKVIADYRSKHGKDLEKVVLVGGGSAMKGFSEAAEANLQADVSVGNPFSKVEAPVFVSDVLKNSGPEFAVALGTALRGLSSEG